MKGIGISLMLGLLLAFVVGFAYWLRASLHTGPQWHVPLDRGLGQVDP